MREITIGIIGMRAIAEIDMAELREWEPARITALFDGIAKIRTAIAGPDQTLVEPSIATEQKPCAGWKCGGYEDISDGMIRHRTHSGDLRGQPGNCGQNPQCNCENCGAPWSAEVHAEQRRKASTTGDSDNQHTGSEHPRTDGEGTPEPPTPTGPASAKAVAKDEGAIRQVAERPVVEQSLPYRIENDREKCSSCGEGETWTVVNPDGALSGHSYGGDEAECDAQEEADALNHAYALGGVANAARVVELEAENARLLKQLEKEVANTNHVADIIRSQGSAAAQRAADLAWLRNHNLDADAQGAEWADLLVNEPLVAEEADRYALGYANGCKEGMAYGAKHQREADISRLARAGIGHVDGMGSILPLIEMPFEQPEPMKWTLKRLGGYVDDTLGLRNEHGKLLGMTSPASDDYEYLLAILDGADSAALSVRKDVPK